jgi:hypothetical protein
MRHDMLYQAESRKFADSARMRATAKLGHHKKSPFHGDPSRRHPIIEGCLYGPVIPMVAAVRLIIQPVRA